MTKSLESITVMLLDHFACSDTDGSQSIWVQSKALDGLLYVFAELPLIEQHHPLSDMDSKSME
jgi:hypothetical protein